MHKESDLRKRIEKMLKSGYNNDAIVFLNENYDLYKELNPSGEGFVNGYFYGLKDAQKDK